MGMKRRRCSPTAALAALLISMALVVLALIAAPGALGAVRDCSGNRPLGQTGAWYGDMSVRNLSCHRAQRALRGAWFSQGGVRVRGWSCYQIGTYGDGVIFRCVRGSKAMRFSAGG
jgi:hypothetical protein